MYSVLPKGSHPLAWEKGKGRKKKESRVMIEETQYLDTYMNWSGVISRKVCFGFSIHASIESTVQRNHKNVCYIECEILSRVKYMHVVRAS